MIKLWSCLEKRGQEGHRHTEKTESTVRGAGQRNGPAVPVASQTLDVRELDREMVVREWGVRLRLVVGLE